MSTYTSSNDQNIDIGIYLNFIEPPRETFPIVKKE